MAHESFENSEIAEILNQYFISIKVDKEERPDIDSIYMSVCQAMTGSGGWPTTIFMTPDQKPFFAGTYFPRTARYGRMGLKELLLVVHQKWENSRETLLESADEVVAYLEKEASPAAEAGTEWLDSAVKHYQQTFDEEFGGFCRYSTDRSFLVPHFEKMLYDNALLLAYCRAYQMTGKYLYLKIAEKTADYVLWEMTAPEGGFYSAQDADSEGEEGKYYLFEPEELTEVLGEKTGNAFNQYFGITRDGNFEGKNIPNLLHHGQETESFSAFGWLFTCSICISQKPVCAATGKENEQLIIRPKETFDGAVPSGNSMMAYNLVKLWLITEETRFEKLAKQQLDFMMAVTSQYQAGSAMFLTALADFLEPPEKVTVVVKDWKDLEELSCRLSLNTIIRVLGEPTKEYPVINDKTTFYICQNHSCLPPVNELKNELSLNPIEKRK